MHIRGIKIKLLGKAVISRSDSYNFQISVLKRSSTCKTFHGSTLACAQENVLVSGS